MQKKTLNILLIIILMSSMLIGLTACGDDEEEDKWREIYRFNGYCSTNKNKNKSYKDLWC